MPQPKATILEMHTAMQEIAERYEFSVRSSSDAQDRPVHPEFERRAFVLNSIVKLLAIMATFEDASRKFLAGLLEEHKRG